MRRDVRAALNTLAEYQIGFGNQFHISRMSGYNIRSSAFRVAGVAADVYIGDLPNTNRQNGSLFLFTLDNPASQNPTIVRRNVGRIDYVKGIGLFRETARGEIMGVESGFMKLLFSREDEKTVPRTYDSPAFVLRIVLESFCKQSQQK